MIGAVGLLGASAPGANAAPTVVTATANCWVTRLLVDSIEGCPAETSGPGGYASATAVANLPAQTFDVAAVARPERMWRAANNARAQIDLVSGTVRSAGGRVQILLTNVVGGTSRHCAGLCKQTNGAYGYVDLMVQLRVKDAAGSGWPYLFCSFAGPAFDDTTTLPPTLVIPDDCESRSGKLEVPPNSSFDVLLSVYADAGAQGSGKARARFAGHVSEIRVP